MSEQGIARAARIRLDAVRDHITDAIEAISGPAPDWLRCAECMDMARDVMPVVEEGDGR